MSRVAALLPSRVRTRGDRRRQRRQVNDGISNVGRSVTVPALLPFRCECDRPGCTATVILGVAEYDAIRSAGRAVTAVS